MAVTHSLLSIFYQMLLYGSSYPDSGANYFDQRNRESARKRAVVRLERLGYKGYLQPA